QGSYDLLTWDDLATNSGTVGSEVTVEDSETFTTGRRFLRLKVTQR
ncbi:MAG: hypothetical protein H7Y06_13295, partial [Opitutaceae bacterium]|nr:hypothetical protein [Opitutaceae bacterium]